MAPTFEDRARHDERESFVGRSAELAQFEDVLDERATKRLVLLYGPGGIGKSTLLRRVTGMAASEGYATQYVTARALTESPEVAAGLVARAAQAQRTLVAIDGWDEAAASGVALRDDVLAHLPDTAIVVIAGRGAPDHEWWSRGWGPSIVAMRLGPLDTNDALTLLGAQGVADGDRAAALVAWAQGLPLALVMAAATEWKPGTRDPDRPLLARLSGHLLDGGVPDGRLEPLTVAATARVTTPAILAAAVPGIDADEAFGWLTTRTYTEPFAGGVALHALVAGVVRAAATERHPDLVRDIRRRLADDFWARALRAGTAVVPDLLHLIENEDVRWGLGWDDSGDYSIDRLREGDLATLERWWATPGDAGEWEWIRRYAKEAPFMVGIPRGRDGVACGLMISCSPNTAPPLTAEDPILGPWLRHAREADQGNSVLWRNATDVSGDPRARVQGLIGVTGIRRSGLANPRWVYLPISPAAPRALAFAAAVGATRVPSLDVRVGDHDVWCHVADLGPGGVLGAYRAVIYGELDLPAPARELVPAEAVREALRNWDDPTALAESPLAIGTTVAERAASVRDRIEAAVGRVFGDGEKDRLLRAVVEQGYLVRAAGHEATASALGLSRAAYFRRLREAAERIAADFA